MPSVPATTLAPADKRVVLRAAAASDPGRVRENNEDRYFFDAERGIYVVVDGVGGHAAGETAAETALLQIRSRLERDAGSAEERLREGITLANNEIHRLSRTNAEWEGMACVLTAAIVEPGTTDDAGVLTIGHVGDSRLYKLRAGRIEKLTHDHSPVGEREDAGHIDEIHAMRHPRRNEVFRDVGSERHTPNDEDFVEIIQTPLERDAAILLCSDGLSDLVTSSEILAVANTHAGRPEAVVRELIARANRAGGKDNVTVVYAEGPAFRSVPLTAGTNVPVRKPKTWTRVVTHSLALILGALFGAAGAIYWPSLLPQLPALPFLNTPETVRPPRSLQVQQASAAAEFVTIGDALRAAQAGDTVVVGPGEYREQVLLPTGVTLVSEVPHRAVIRPPATGPAGAAVLVDGARGARMQGFQILGDQEAMQFGVVVLSGELELEDTRITSATGAGVDVWAGTRVTLRANDISNNTGVGVRVRSGAAPSLLHNHIVRNGRSAQAAPGVLLDADATPVLVGNVIADNGAEGIAGVSARDGAEFLRNNVFVADSRGNARGALGVIGAPVPARR